MDYCQWARRRVIYRGRVPRRQSSDQDRAVRLGSWGSMPEERVGRICMLDVNLCDVYTMLCRKYMFSSAWLLTVVTIGNAFLMHVYRNTTALHTYIHTQEKQLTLVTELTPLADRTYPQLRVKSKVSNSKRVLSFVPLSSLRSWKNLTKTTFETLIQYCLRQISGWRDIREIDDRGGGEMHI